MTDIQTRVYRGIGGLINAETDYPLDDSPAGETRILSLHTMKRYNGRLETTAKVYTVDGAWRMHEPFSAFSGVIESDKVRVTERMVEAQHARAKAKITEIKEAVRGFYKQQAEKEAAPC